MGMSSLGLRMYGDKAVNRDKNKIKPNFLNDAGTFTRVYKQAVYKNMKGGKYQGKYQYQGITPLKKGKTTDGKNVRLYEIKAKGYVKSSIMGAILLKKDDLSVTDFKKKLGKLGEIEKSVNDAVGLLRIGAGLYALNKGEFHKIKNGTIKINQQTARTLIGSKIEIASLKHKKDIRCELPKFTVESKGKKYGIDNSRKLGAKIGWGKRRFGIPKLWRKTQGAGVRVAVLDTGIEYNHVDLKGAIVAKKDFTGSKKGASDVDGHGTHVAGTIGARLNGTGYFGVAPESKLLIAKVLGDNGRSTGDSVERGIKWAIVNGARIISMSLGSRYYSASIHKAIKEAIANNILVIVAAGNDGPYMNTVGYPGKLNETLAVGSLNRYGGVSLFSSRGKDIDIIAPGEEIISTYLGDTSATLSGTSMATPFVSGVAALWVAYKIYKGEEKEINQENFVTEVRGKGIDTHFRGVDQSSGSGMINPFGLLGMAP